MTEPGPASTLAETLLDAGRQRLFSPRVPGGGHRLAETLLDEGRRRPDPVEPGRWPEDGSLPAELAERYERGDPRRDVTTNQSRLLHVRVRATGAEAMVKHHLAPRTRSPQVEAYLSASRSHVVSYLEFGRDFEVMEYLSGGSLAQRREDAPDEFEYENLHSLVQQLAAALIDLHRQGLVHRDVKPANVGLRKRSGRGGWDVALIDFGRAGPPADAAHQDGSNPAYQPPEWILGSEVTPAYDWWALGMTVAELASGAHPLAGLDRASLEDHFTKGRRVDVSGVPAMPSTPPDRLRWLCRGLLTQDPDDRWGPDEVGKWLVGGEPDLPSEPVRAGAPDRRAAATPFEFRAVEYRHRDELATEFSTYWNHAVDVLFGAPGRIADLTDWLDQFTDDEGIAARAAVAATADTDRPRHVRLLDVLVALDPTRPAIYRNHIISRDNLRAMAHHVMQGAGDAASVLEDLWEYRLLPRFDSAAPPSDAEFRGDALTELDEDWQRERARWPDLVGEVGDRGAVEYLRISFSRQSVLAACLRMALRNQPDNLAAQQLVQWVAIETAPAVPWYPALAGRPHHLWIAVALAGYARARAETIADAAEAAWRADQELRRNAGFREWSRRQNRAVALGWAVAGVTLIALLLIVLVAGSDRAGRAVDTAVELAWGEAAIGLAVSLVAECLLAVHVGGRFHQRYSIPGAGRIAMVPVGRWMQRHSLPALAVIVAAALALAYVTAHWPQAMPPGVMLAHLIWVGRRWHAWDVQTAAEDERIREEARRGPSEASDTSRDET